MKIKDIAENIGKSEQSVRNLLNREGVRTISHKETVTKVSDVICPNCRAKGHYKGAKFCYKCGADVRTESDILRERLGKLVADFQYLPDSIRDNAYAVVQDTIDYLRKV
jgi:RecJ-like exonuclease